MIEVKAYGAGATPRGTRMDSQGMRRPRALLEERMVEVRCLLAMGGACTGADVEGWRNLEEELLNELHDLERDLQAKTSSLIR